MGLLPPLPMTQCPREQLPPWEVAACFLPGPGLVQTPFNSRPALSQQGFIQPPGEQAWGAWESSW